MTSIIYPTTNLKQVEQLNIVKGEGIYVYDDVGNKYLEGLAGLWCASLGFGENDLNICASMLPTDVGCTKSAYTNMFPGKNRCMPIGSGEM